MAKLYKLELYITDYSQYYYNKEDILIDIERHLDNVLIDCYNSEEVKVNWHDDIDLNYNSKTRETFEKYFKETK